MLDLRFGHHIGVTLSKKKNYEAQLLNNLILKGEIEKNIYIFKKRSKSTCVELTNPATIDTRLR